MKDKVVKALVHPDHAGSVNTINPTDHANPDKTTEVWRPSNWRNPYCDDYPQRSADYEDGADAMFRAVYRESERVTAEIIAILRAEIRNVRRSNPYYNLSSSFKGYNDACDRMLDMLKV